MARLDKRYKKGDTLSKFHVLKAFGEYKRPINISIIEHTNEFEKCLHKVKNYGVQMSYDVLYQTKAK